MKKYVKDVGVKYFSCKIPSPAKKKKKKMDEYVFRSSHLTGGLEFEGFFFPEILAEALGFYGGRI